VSLPAKPIIDLCPYHIRYTLISIAIKAVMRLFLVFNKQAFFETLSRRGVSVTSAVGFERIEKKMSFL